MVDYNELASKLLKLEPADEPTKAKSASYPTGWEPGVIWNGDRGEITTGSVDGPPSDWSLLLAERGLDPNLYEVVGDTVRWCSYDGWKRDNPDEKAYSAICYSYKAEIRRRSLVLGTDAEELFKEIRKDKKPKPAKPGGDATWVVNLSDWQIGNADAGGARTQLEALAALPDLLGDALKKLQKSQPVNHVVVAGLGDLVEGTCGFYPSQTFSVELDRREQVRVVRRALTELIRSLAQRGLPVTVTAVGGNHGENRKDGKRYTGFGDNDDVAVFEQVSEIFSESSYGNVGFRLPSDRMAVAMELHGQIVAWTHGHIPRPKGNAAETMWGWWKDQIMGRFYPAVADANVLVTGHYHHLNVKQQEGRTVFVCPSLTAVGDWYSNSSGVQTVPGTLTFRLDANGWNTLEVIR